MKRAAAALALIAAAAWAGACRPADEPQQVDERLFMAQGRQFYEARCVACHRIDGSGEGAFPSLQENQFVMGDPDDVIAVILRGRGVAMPAFSDQMSDTDIAATVSYIRNAFGNNASFVSTEDVARVREDTEP